MTGFICGPRIYEYKGVTIELSYSGPWPINKRGEPYQRLPHDVSLALDEFIKMGDEESEKYRTGGGCQRFGNE